MKDNGEKNFIFRFIGHSKTINYHRYLVAKNCFACGLYWHGLIHDLSKYSFVEFFSGVKYYQGNRSPIDKEKQVKGVSYGWLHHKGHNKHHWEYWCDLDRDNNVIKCNYIPPRYLVESICDRLAASKVYLKDKYENDSAYKYYMNSKDKNFINKENDLQFQYYLHQIALYGFKETSKQLKEFVKTNGASFYNKK